MYSRLSTACHAGYVLHEVITSSRVRLWHTSYVHAASCNIIPLGMCQIGKRYVADRTWNITRKPQIDCQKYHNIKLDELLNYEILLRQRNICAIWRKMGIESPQEAPGVTFTTYHNLHCKKSHADTLGFSTFHVDFFSFLNELRALSALNLVVKCGNALVRW